MEPCNRAFTPTEEERLEFYRETRRLFAEGIAKGTAAIPYPGTTMMIDVPVDERARITLELYERCAGARRRQGGGGAARTVLRILASVWINWGGVGGRESRLSRLPDHAFRRA